MMQRDESRRRAPRFAVAEPVQIGGMRMFTCNLSASGMQVVCPKLVFEVIAKEVHSGAVEVAMLTAPEDGLRLQCRVVYASDHDDEVLMGLQVTAFAEGAGQRWTGYVDEIAGRSRPVEG